MNVKTIQRITVILAPYLIAYAFKKYEESKDAKKK